jgi:hypothetical protein
VNASSPLYSTSVLLEGRDSRSVVCESVKFLMLFTLKKRVIAECVYVCVHSCACDSVYNTDVLLNNQK